MLCWLRALLESCLLAGLRACLLACLLVCSLACLIARLLDCSLACMVHPFDLYQPCAVHSVRVSFSSLLFRGFLAFVLPVVFRFICAILLLHVVIAMALNAGMIERHRRGLALFYALLRRRQASVQTYT